LKKRDKSTLLLQANKEKIGNLITLFVEEEREIGVFFVAQ